MKCKKKNYTTPFDITYKIVCEYRKLADLNHAREETLMRIYYLNILLEHPCRYPRELLENDDILKDCADPFLEDKIPIKFRYISQNTNIVDNQIRQQIENRIKEIKEKVAKYEKKAKP